MVVVVDNMAVRGILIVDIGIEAVHLLQPRV